MYLQMGLVTVNCTVRPIIVIPTPTHLETMQVLQVTTIESPILASYLDKQRLVEVVSDLPMKKTWDTS